jgi:hypothetical protein
MLQGSTCRVHKASSCSIAAQVITRVHFPVAVPIQLIAW